MVGPSPKEVPVADVFPHYHRVFIDGERTDHQLEVDVAAVDSSLASAAIVVHHDVGFIDFHGCVTRLPSS